MKSAPKISKEFLDKVHKKKMSRKFRGFLILSFLVFLAVLFCSGDYGLLKIYRLHTKINTAEADIVRLKAQAVDLNWEINKLKADTGYIRLYASEHYGYAKPDQTIIQFLPSPDDSIR
jgi:cell division protein FtsB